MISSRKGLLQNAHLLLALVPIFYKSEMPGIIRIVEDLKEGTLRLRRHRVEAGFEGGEEVVDVLGGDSDADMEADAMKCVRVLNMGRHDARLHAE